MWPERHESVSGRIFGLGPGISCLQGAGPVVLAARAQSAKAFASGKTSNRLPGCISPATGSHLDLLHTEDPNTNISHVRTFWLVLKSSKVLFED